MPQTENTNKPLSNVDPNYGDDAHAQAPTPSATPPPSPDGKGEQPVELEQPAKSVPESKREAVSDPNLPDAKFENVNFDDFMGVLDKPKTILPAKTTPEEKKLTTNEEKKPVETPVQTKPKEIQQQIPAPKKENAQIQERELEAFPEDLRPVLRQMSNDAFNKIAPILKEHPQVRAELENLKKNAQTANVKQEPAVWEHERAYTLTPDWEQLQNEASTASVLQSHWEEQLAKMEDGQDWEDLEQDDKGNLFKTKPKPNDARAKAYVMRNLLGVQAHTEKIKERGIDLIKNHTGRYKADVATVEEATQNFFGVYFKPESSFSKVIENTLKKFPASFRNSPVSKLFAGAVADNVRLRLELDSLRKNQGTKASFDEAVKVNGSGPSSKEINSGGSVKSTDSFANIKMSDFDSLVK